MDKTRIVISAREVLCDVRAGMDDEAFMKKYNLSFRQLQRLFRKMILAGFISPQELAKRLCITRSQVMEAIDQMNKAILELDE
ncbi:MAG TPA: hypothetical protein VK463_08065 [Desulfomonilaceae bacterium]|nr:hypothetical protein [Desulfomonilaceae bacterium]